MSRRRQKPERTQKNVKSNSFQLLVSTLLTSTLTLLLNKPLELLQYVKNLLICIMMVGKRELPDPGVHEKKRARVLNKQNKMLAMYRLVKGAQVEVQEEVKGQRLGDEEFKRMKKELADRKKALMQLPRFYVNSGAGSSAQVYSTPYNKRTPILLSDIEHLVTYAYGGNALVPPPSRWCGLQKPNRLNNIVILVVKGVGLSEFVDNEEQFSGTMGIFGGSDDSNRCIVEFLSPEWYGASIEKEIMDWGLLTGEPKPQQSLTQTLESNAAAQQQATQDLDPPQFNEPAYTTMITQLSSVFPITGKLKKKQKTLPPTDKFSRTELVLTLPQLIQESYPLRIPSNALSKTGFVPTADNYAPVNPNSRLFSIDCEMCSTAKDPQALTRVAIIDEDMNVVYESLVKPENRITDYLTRWSGITREMLKDVEVTIRDVHERVRGLVEEFPDCVFVGQSLNCDLKAMKMTHPYVIDTSCIFNLTGIEGRKSSLRDLAYNLLDHKIQVQDRSKVVGHCPVEDATAAMRLVKAKLEFGFSFGNALRNPTYLLKSTKLAIDTSFMGNSFKQSKLDKNVLLVSQDDSPSTNLITHLKSTSNSSTVKGVSTRIFEYFMSIGFYRVNADSENYAKSLHKLDKRVAKLYENLGENTLFLVVCSKDCGGCDGGGAGEEKRKNNGVALVRCKVSDVPKRNVE